MLFIFNPMSVLGRGSVRTKEGEAGAKKGIHTHTQTHTRTHTRTQLKQHSKTKNNIANCVSFSLTTDWTYGCGHRGGGRSGQTLADLPVTFTAGHPCPTPRT